MIKFYKRFIYVLLIIFIFSCKKETHNTFVSGKIQGLKKGTLYLEKVKDNTFVIVDSVVVNGNPEFILNTILDQPEVLHLRLNRNANVEDRISFFADKGTTQISTSLRRFIFDAKINGSVQQKKLEEFNSFISLFNDKNLNLIKAQFEASKANNIKALDSIQFETENLLKRKYLYVINFALNNKNSHIAPYVTLNEAYNANIKYLDTIYNSLEDSIAVSKYGVQLKDFIANIKKTENTIE